MKLTIYSVYPAGRDWTDWLGQDVSEGSISRDNYTDIRWYQGDGRFLALVHYSAQLEDEDELKGRDIERKWSDLPYSVRHRVFWLVYSGSGYWRLHSRQPNVHFLRYAIGTGTIHGSDKSRLRMLCEALKTDDEVQPSMLWDAAYPNENVHAATLLAILSADEIGVDISSAVAAVLAEHEMLRRAQREFAAHAKSGTASPDLNSWIDDLERRNYRSIRTQLREAFGGVLG